MGMYRTLFYAGLIVALLCLLLSVVLFFVFKIPKAFGVVTGRAQKKAIEEIRASGYESKSKKDAIHAGRDQIHVRDAEMDTGALHKKGTGNLTGNSSGSLERDAVKDAARDSSPAARRRAGRGRAGKDVTLENEETEVLGFESSADRAANAANSGGDADSTDVLSADGSMASQRTAAGQRKQTVGLDDATDVLSGSGADADAGRTAGGRSYAGYDEETDVLSAGPSVKDTSEDATDVLLRGPRDYSETDDMETDVLVSGSEFTPQDEEIVGRYSAEETAVLRSIHIKPEEGSSSGKGIRVLYSETIVHTEESLLS